MFQAFADWVTYDLLSIAADTRLGGAVNFFIYDTLKIFTLLASIIFIISIIRSYFPPEKTKCCLAISGSF